MSDNEDCVENFIITHQKPRTKYYKFSSNINKNDNRPSYCKKRIFKTPKNKIGFKYDYCVDNLDKIRLEKVYRQLKNKKGYAQGN